MRIGICIAFPNGQSIWAGGSMQRAVFLARLLQRLPFVSAVVLVAVNDQAGAAPQMESADLRLPVLPWKEAGDAVDLLIDLSGCADTGWLALQRARGKKVVLYAETHPFAGMVEASVFDRPAPRFDAARCDEVWIFSTHQPFAAFLRVLHRCPVREAPFLWQPAFVRQRAEEIAALGYHYGWDAAAARDGLRVAIFEPNVSVTKTASIAMLVCDEACRADGTSVRMMHVLNSHHMKDHPTLLYLANALDLVRQQKACFHGRHDVVGFMAQSADAVVSHQWTQEQNTLHLDVLYGDYPLVHNSDWLSRFGAGYHYPGFETAQGGHQLRIALAEHAQRLPDQRRAAQALFDAVDPESPVNQGRYAELLQQLCRDRPEWVRA